MKSFLFYAKMMLCFGIVFLGLLDTTEVFANGPHPPAKVNWVNTMGCDASGSQCIYLDDANNTIQFILRVRFSAKVKDLAQYPQMKFYYNVGNGKHVGYTNAASNDMIEPILLEDGTSANEVIFPVNISVNDLCSSEIDGSFYYDIQYQFITNEASPYPIGAHADLFPTDVFDVPSSVYESTLEKLTKNVCCNTCIHTCQDIFEAYPNPFQDALEVRYNLNQATEVVLTCINGNGAQLIQQKIDHEAGGDYNYSLATNNWPDGVYFVLLLRNDELETIKVIKQKK